MLRQTFLLLLSLVLATTLLHRPSLLAGEPGKPKAKKQQTQQVSAADALRLLKEGNRRFVDGHLKHPHESKQRRERLVSRQKPIATVLGCSDSRVIPELIFDEGIGDLFVIRVAGQVPKGVLLKLIFFLEPFTQK